MRLLETQHVQLTVMAYEMAKYRVLQACQPHCDDTHLWLSLILLPEVLSPSLSLLRRQNDPVYAVTLSGGYKDDADGQEEIIYTGQGGQKGGIQVSTLLNHV